MKTNNLKALLLAAALVTGSTPVWAQTSVPATAPASAPASSTVASTTTPPTMSAVPTTISPAAVPPAASAPVGAMVPPASPTLTQTTSPLPDSNALTSTGQGTDPAITAVLDRLKQDTTPLSISDMSSAQDALARLNLMNEIEQKLSQIEETRAKRLGVAGMAGLDAGGGGSLAPQQVLNQASGFGGGGATSRHHSSSNAQILAISGASGRYSATIDWNGREMIVKPGSFLPDGSKVIKVGADEVITASHGKNTTLSFAEAKTADNGGGHTISSSTAPPNNPAGN